MPLTPLAGLLRTALQGSGNLLSLLPRGAYRTPMGRLGFSRRSIWIVNAPELVRRVLVEEVENYPKSDLMVHALEPLIGDAMFVSSGEVWRRQRQMIDPAFSLMRLSRAFGAMAEAVDAGEPELDAMAAGAEEFSLDMLMSRLTADIICRAVFSTSLQSRMARDVFDAFARFERNVAQVNIWRLIFDPAWTRTPQAPEVLSACAVIRAHLGELLDGHLQAAQLPDDIAGACIAARDESGAAFSRGELIDQLGVLFLAGHETTASGLTWAFYILAQQPGVMARIRAEVDGVCGDGPVGFEQLRLLHFTRAVWRETLRLYPPITFLPRVASEASALNGHRIRRGALMMIAPWVLHRHRAYWRDPNAFDPERFMGAREAEIVPGSYIPFGAGPRVCVGAGLAGTEAVLILARLARRYDFSILPGQKVRPEARLTTRPAAQIMCRVVRREAA